jgi:hypothetical protein
VLSDNFMKKMKSKYLATQLSAPIIGFLTLFFAIFIIKDMFPSIFYEMSLVKVALIIILFTIILIGSMLLWGRVLVLFGALTEDEAKGYPYSKPWEDN